ncbi:MAG: DUF4340 domain-containing protein [Acidobacteriota bacterium]|jgi:hypothetical protein|nr:DUF4340 domain-containing protein [Acidobacteriota bacterium]
MRFKGTFTLLAVALLFGGYIYFYEYKGGAEREAAKKTENRVWKFDPGDIVRVDLATQDGAATAEREDGRWTLTAPHRWWAEASELERLVSSASALDRESVVEEKASDLGRYGLNPALLSLRLKAKDGNEYGIDFGADTPSGNSTYATLSPGDGSVFLVQSGTTAFFDKKVAALRDRKVFRFERAGVQGLTLRNAKGVVELEKDRDDRWWFKGSEKREADGPAMRELLNALDLGTVAEFFDDEFDIGDEGTVNYANTALETPAIDAVLTFGPGKAIRRFVVGPAKSTLGGQGDDGATAQAERYLARDDARPELFFVEKDLVDKLSKSADDLRSKALVPFQRWDVDGIDLENPKGKVRLVKAGGDWFLQGGKRKAKWDEVNGILDALEKPVREWIDAPAPLSEYGVEAPSMRVTLKKGETVIAQCAFGAAAEGGGVYAKVGGDSAIKVADPEGLEFLGKAEPDYLDPAKK